MVPLEDAIGHAGLICSPPSRAGVLRPHPFGEPRSPAPQSLADKAAGTTGERET
jgi:hypothetical protein